MIIPDFSPELKQIRQYMSTLLYSKRKTQNQQTMQKSNISLEFYANGKHLSI
jgi:hypothetical protein